MERLALFQGVMMQEKYFKSFIPLELEKAQKDGEWRIRGLASTAKRDRQGEVVLQEGLDLTPINQKRGIFNFDHQPGVENIVGLIDSAKKTEQGLIVEGRLFKNHDKAKAIYQIMSSLDKEDRSRMGMSVEGIIKERAGDNQKIIKQAVISKVAITMAPVNEDTFVDLVKSLGVNSVDFNDLAELSISDDLNKSLSVTGAYATSTPAQLSGGDALAQEGFGSKKKKKFKKMTSVMAKSLIGEVLNKIQVLYPEYSRVELWEIFKDRLNQKFPDLN